ncbi:hypothetical protein RCL1_004404 [Eukaryota sp. TZLM3-RCL]
MAISNFYIDEWTLAMKMRLYTTCFAATSASKCNCGEITTLHHVLNCKNLRVYLTLIHDSVKHCLRNFVSAHGVPVLLEQTFKQLHPKMSSADKMDLVTSSVGGIELLLDVASVDTCSHSSCNLSPFASLSDIISSFSTSTCSCSISFKCESRSLRISFFSSV